MHDKPFLEVSYYPGCSLATSARESNQSLVRACEFIGLNLIELEDWNCCGSSSAHALDRELALGLASRNLMLAPDDRPLLIMCPACFKNMQSARQKLSENPDLRRSQERKWGGKIDPELKIISFLEILNFLDKLREMGSAPLLDIQKPLKGLKAAPYYGCMSMMPKNLRAGPLKFGLLDKQLSQLGVSTVIWPGAHKCCGTYLSVTHPHMISELIDDLMQSAKNFKADCLVTACAMCQLNLELRASAKAPLPTFHFSEIIAIALGARDFEKWFDRHLVDPRPLLRQLDLIA